MLSLFKIIVFFDTIIKEFLNRVKYFKKDKIEFIVKEIKVSMTNSKFLTALTLTKKSIVEEDSERD